MKKLTEESKEFQDLKTQWLKDAKIQTEKTFPEFIHSILHDYEHDYGTICHAVAVIAVAGAWVANNSEQGGITGFQAGCIMWEFIRHWTYSHNKIGLGLIDFDNLLYPQYEKDYTEPRIKKYTWEALKKEAKRLLFEKSDAHPEVKAHWESIANGKIPFGLRLED